MPLARPMAFGVLREFRCHLGSANPSTGSGKSDVIPQRKVLGFPVPDAEVRLARGEMEKGGVST